MSIEEIERLSVAERMELMEEIWASCRREIAEPETPEWHQKILRERLKKLEEGVASYSIEEARTRLRG
jgi:hypothetical protein